MAISVPTYLPNVLVGSKELNKLCVGRVGTPGTQFLQPFPLILSIDRRET